MPIGGHIPGAIYANLDTHLSALHGAPGATGTVTAHQADEPASGGRHPLPTREALRHLARRAWASANGMQAVVYDRNGSATTVAVCGGCSSGLGHDAVAVLDGSLQAWQAGWRIAVASRCRDPPRFQSTHFRVGRPPLRQLASAASMCWHAPAATAGPDPDRCAGRAHRATGARSNHSTPWPATFPAHSIARFSDNIGAGRPLQAC
jgi:thiosulfate/3-mercaptopyruvate sulfurtransferase